MEALPPKTPRPAHSRIPMLAGASDAVARSKLGVLGITQKYQAAVPLDPLPPGVAPSPVRDGAFVWDGHSGAGSGVNPSPYPNLNHNPNPIRNAGSTGCALAEAITPTKPPARFFGEVAEPLCPPEVSTQGMVQEQVPQVSTNPAASPAAADDFGSAGGLAMSSGLLSIHDGFPLSEQCTKLTSDPDGDVDTGCPYEDRLPNAAASEDEEDCPVSILSGSGGSSGSDAPEKAYVIFTLGGNRRRRGCCHALRTFFLSGPPQIAQVAPELERRPCIVQREAILSRLYDSGLDVTELHEGYGVDSRPVMCVTASEEQLEAHAETIGLVMRVLAIKGGGLASFSKDRKNVLASCVLAEREERCAFRNYEQQYLLHSLVEQVIAQDIGEGLRRGVLSNYFPLHDNVRVHHLGQSWASWKAVLELQPLAEVFEYFGEEVATFFALEGHFLAWCGVLAFFGLFAFALQLGYSTVDHFFLPAFCLLCAAAAVLYSWWWNTYHHRLVREWDYIDPSLPHLPEELLMHKDSGASGNFPGCKGEGPGLGVGRGDSATWEGGWDACDGVLPGTTTPRGTAGGNGLTDRGSPCEMTQRVRASRRKIPALLRPCRNVARFVVGGCRCNSLCPRVSTVASAVWWASIGCTLAVAVAVAAAVTLAWGTGLLLGLNMLRLGSWDRFCEKGYLGREASLGAGFLNGAAAVLLNACAGAAVSSVLAVHACTVRILAGIVIWGFNKLDHPPSVGQSSEGGKRCGNRFAAVRDQLVSVGASPATLVLRCTVTFALQCVTSLAVLLFVLYAAADVPDGLRVDLAHDVAMGVVVVEVVHRALGSAFFALISCVAFRCCKRRKKLSAHEPGLEEGLECSMKETILAQCQARAVDNLTPSVLELGRHFTLVVFFAPVFPPTPILLLVYHAVMLRRRAHSLVQHRQRPFVAQRTPTGPATAWLFTALHVISLLATVHCCALLALRAESLALYLPKGVGDERITRLWVFILAEHLVIVLRVVVQYVSVWSGRSFNAGGEGPMVRGGTGTGAPAATGTGTGDAEEDRSSIYCRTPTPSKARRGGWVQLRNPGPDRTRWRQRAVGGRDAGDPIDPPIFTTPSKDTAVGVNKTTGGKEGVGHPDIVG